MPVFKSAVTVPNITNSSLTLGSIPFAGTDGLESQDNSNLFWDNTNKRIGLRTAVPTTSLTLGSTATGITSFNTADQTVNYERVTKGWSGNIYTIGTEWGGTGTARKLRIGSAGGAGGIIGRYVDFQSSVPFFQFTPGTTANISASVGWLDITGVKGASSSIQIGLSVTPTISQSDTAGYTLIMANAVTGSGTGSGTKLLLDLQTAGTSRFSVDSTGNMTSTGATINTVSSGSATQTLKLVDSSAGATPNKYLRVNSGSLQVVNSAFSTGIATLTDAGGWSVASLTASSLTSGRVTYATTSGLLTDSANLTFDGTALVVSGNQKISTYLRVGSASTPNATAAGNLTVETYLTVGINAAPSVNGWLARFSGSNTSIASGSEACIGVTQSLTPPSNSATEHKSLNFENVWNPTTGIAQTGPIFAGYFANRIRGDGLVSTTVGVTARAMIVDSSSAATVQATTVRGIDIYGWARLSGTSTSTVGTIIGCDASNVAPTGTGGLTATTITSFLVGNAGSGNTITTLLGLDVPVLNRGSTNNIGVRIAAPSGGTNNFALQLSDTGGSATGGITFGTDTNLYRSAADTLTTDDAFSTPSYLRVGAIAAPTNTTAGDLTCSRFIMPNGSFSTTGQIFYVNNTVTATSAIGIYSSHFNATAQPASNSSATVHGLALSVSASATAGVTQNDLRPFYMEVSHRQTGSISITRGAFSCGLLYAGGSPATPGLVGTSSCFEALPFYNNNVGNSSGSVTTLNSFSTVGVSTAGLTVSTCNGFVSQTNTAGTFTNIYGVNLFSQTRASSSNIGVVVAANGIATGIGSTSNLMSISLGGGAVALGDQTATTTNAHMLNIAIPTYTSTTNVRTITNCAGLYIAGAPVASTNVTITNGPYALWVDSGDTRLDGNVVVLGSTTTGDAAASTAQLIVKGGSGGNAMVTLQRTSGATIQFSWALTGGGLAFSDDTNGFVAANVFGDGSQNQIYVGAKSKITSDTRVCVLGATTFTSAAGTDIAGNELRIQGGLGTGAGASGNITFYTNTTLASGATAQAGTLRVTINNLGLTIADARDIIVGTTTGTKIGTSTSQKLGFFNATPIVQPSNTTDLRQALINLGLYATGGATPLNLNGGALTADLTNCTGTAAGLTAGNATTLATPRTINGVSFNGSANITIPSSVTATEIEVDFGSMPVTSATFTITDATISAASNIMISLTGKTATDRVGNDYTWDSISYSAVPGTGNFVLDAVVNNGSVVGKRKLIYSVAN